MEKTSRMTAEEERRQGFEARRKEEALRRLEQLTKAFELNGEILNQLKEGAIHFPDFLLCIISEKIKENDFPVSLRQG